MNDMDAWKNLCFARMQACDIDDVIAIENQVYPYPWTRGNFLDSLAHDYEAWLVRNQGCDLLAYFLAMCVLKEAHLLNIAVRHDLHGQGLGRMLLDNMMARLSDKGMESVLLEVRPSNQRAIIMYQHRGFYPIGRRKSYYPAAGNMREDAIVMRLIL